MGDHRVAVLGDLHVELERADPQLESAGERRDGALHRQTDAASVGLQVERLPAVPLGGLGRHHRGDQARDQAECGEQERAAPHRTSSGRGIVLPILSPGGHELANTR
jgi:hypothetical protein